MPSRADRRRRVEFAWRALALALLAWALVRAFRGPERGAERVDGDALAAELPRLTRAPGPVDVAVALRAAPAAEPRAWLAALRRAGGRVEWSADTPIPPLALEVVPRADPAGGVRALVAGARGDALRFADAAGPLDTLVMPGDAAALRLPAFVPPLRVTDGSQPAAARPADSLAPRALRVLGAAGWEGKFLLAALEERGWRAGAQFTVAPAIAVAQGATRPLDTARDAAVIVLDSAAAAANARRITAFVREGGGLILAGGAARAAAVAAIAPGAVAAHVRPAALTFTDSAPRRALGFDAIAPLASTAIPLESRDGRVAVAARRAGAGRVLQAGFDESWRWRFAGGPRAPEAERAWWSELVSSVSYRAAIPLGVRNSDAAPLAQLTEALGPPSAERRAPRSAVSAASLSWWLLTLILAALLAEYASRRVRGAP